MFSKLSYNLPQTLLPPPDFILIHQEVPRINIELQNLNCSIYIVYMSNKHVNIYTKVNNLGTYQKKPSPLLRRIYFIRNKSNGVLLGNGYEVHYNPNSLVYVKERFSFEWNKKIGLFSQTKKESNFLPNYNQTTLTRFLSINYRRLWSN